MKMKAKIKHAEIQNEKDILHRHMGMISEYVATIARSGFTDEEADKIYQEWTDKGQNPEELFGDENLSKALDHRLARAALSREADPSKYFMGKAKYLIVEKGVGVHSPAGFHPTDNVWCLDRESSVQIQTDVLPSLSDNLIAYDLEAAKGEVK